MEKFINLKDLPRHKKGTNKGKINWNETIGYKVDFQYKDVRGVLKIVDCDSKRESLTVRYNGNDYDLKMKSLKQCQLGVLLKKYTGDFKFNDGDVIITKECNLIVLDKEYRNKIIKAKEYKKDKWYKCKCTKCGWSEYWVSEGHLLRKRGCACCAGKVVVPGINDVATTNPELVKFFKNKEDATRYTRGSKEEVIVVCPNCKSEKTMEVRDLYGNGFVSCTCRDGFSMGHKYIYKLLQELNIAFLENNTPKWSRYYSEYKNDYTYGEYDFIVDDKKIIIEVDGHFHRKDNKMNGQTQEESKYIDEMKDSMARENGYKVIRIRYDRISNFKNDILDSELCSEFNISEHSINWNICNEFAISTMIKNVADYWNSKQEYETTKDLAILFNISKNTVINYLNEGNSLGLCIYNGTEEMIKNNARSGERAKKHSSKKIEIFKDGISLGVFESISTLERESLELFGVKLLNSKISAVAKGDRNHHKGYTFKYVQ